MDLSLRPGTPDQGRSRRLTYKDLDLRLIEALREDARCSIRGLAKRLDVSPGTVTNRLESLEERGVIIGFAPVLDYEKLGFPLVAVTKIKARGDRLRSIVTSLAADPRLTHVYEITGDFDILAIGRFRDEKDMNSEIKRMLSLPGIEGTNTSIVLDAVKEGEVDLSDSTLDEPGSR